MTHERLPEDWHLMQLDKILKKVSRPIDVHPGTEYRQIGIRSHGKGIFHKEPVLGSDLGTKSIFWVMPGDFVLNIVFAWEGAVAVVTDSELGMCGSHRFPTFVANRDKLEMDYLIRYFKSHEGVAQLRLVSPGGAGRNKTLSQGDFLRLNIPLPPLDEQRRIIEVLRDADTNITRVEAQIKAAQEVKRGAMQKYYSQAYDDDSIPNVQLKKLMKSVSRSEAIVENQLYKLCGVKWHAEGVHIHDELLGAEIKTRQLSRVAKGDVMYNKMWASNRAFGIAKEEHDGAYVTSEYPQFIIQKELLFPTYLEKFFYSYPCQMQAKIFSKGTTSRSRVNPRDFLRIQLPLPSLHEQCEIATILSAHDEMIFDLHAEEASLREIKRGLMQNLLNGRIRV